MQNDQFINDFAEKLQSIGTLHALGDTWISFDSTVPAGGVPFCGQLVSRNLWADLYAWASAQGKVKTESEWQAYATAHGGNCPFYSSGDNDTNFRMPRFAAYFKGADSTEDGGMWIAEGLPNIEGEVAGSASGLSEGAFQDGDKSIDTKTSGAKWGESFGRRVDFSASLSNPIYGASEHVTPETCTVLVGVYAVGIVATVGATDVDKIASTVASLEANLLAKSTPHIVESWIAEDGSSWYRKYSNGWIEQGGLIECTTTWNNVVTLPVAYKDTNFTVLHAAAWGNSGDEKHPPRENYSERTTTSISLSSIVYLASGMKMSWMTLGY